VVSSSADIRRSATIEMKGAPSVTDMMPSAAIAATHDDRLSILAGRTPSTARARRTSLLIPSH
jgi:hypothetical protein